MAVVQPDTLVTVFLSESGYKAEREVLEEMKELGAKTLVVANTADERTPWRGPQSNTGLVLRIRLFSPRCSRTVGLPGGP
jgi:fructoselysine-6-P-deglycase FrlB-like protein